jgi:uncharacterized protein YjbJ (UPF0337 family)
MDERKRELQNEAMENELKGAGNDLKGRLKDAAGGLTGDTSLQLEGKIDRLKGKAQGKLGDIQRNASES